MSVENRRVAGIANTPVEHLRGHRLPLERRAVASAKRSQEAWQRGEMIGWRQQVVGDQRVEEMLGRQARCPKNVPQGGDDEARRESSTEWTFEEVEAADEKRKIRRATATESNSWG